MVYVFPGTGYEQYHVYYPNICPEGPRLKRGQLPRRRVERVEEFIKNKTTVVVLRACPEASPTPFPKYQRAMCHCNCRIPAYRHTGIS